MDRRTPQSRYVIAIYIPSKHRNSMPGGHNRTYLVGCRCLVDLPRDGSLSNADFVPSLTDGRPDRTIKMSPSLLLDQQITAVKLGPIVSYFRHATHRHESQTTNRDASKFQRRVQPVQRFSPPLPTPPARAPPAPRLGRY